MATTVVSVVRDSCPIGSRDFNGTTDRIDWSSVSTLTGSAVTISLWLKWHATSLYGYEYLLNIQNATDLSRSLYLMTWQNTGVDRAVQFARVGSTNLYRNTAGNQFSSNVWTHILATHDGTFTDYTKMHVYVGGAEVTYAANQNGATETAPSGKWCLGGRTYDDTTNLNGQLCQVAVWNRVLNGTEIANLANKYSPAYAAPSSLLYYFTANTSSLAAYVGGTGTADGTTWVADGPDIKYYAP